MSIVDTIMAHLNPVPNPELKKASERWQQQLPTLWLLGKTGAGKSSLIQAVTGNSNAEIGNGFRPCTMHSQRYDYPTETPVLRFLDTRGLSEADYDAEEDIQHCQAQSHALIVVMKAEEPEQSGVLTALKQIQSSGAIKQLLLVHTGIAQFPSDAERDRCIHHNREQVASIWKADILEALVDFEAEDGNQLGINQLKEQLCDLLPILSQLYSDTQHASIEEQNFNQLKTEVLWYASIAGTSDAIPGVGLVSVPSIQAKMLHSLANQYNVEWNKQLMSEFFGALGTGFGVQYVGRLGIRQLIKFIPVYGQTLGAATAAALSFCSTYAIGRVSCKYLYHKNKDETVSTKSLSLLYQQAFNEIKTVAQNETRRK